MGSRKNSTHFICYKPCENALLFLKTPEPITIPEARKIVMGDAHLLGAKFCRIWSVCEAKWEYAKTILTEEDV